MDRKTKGVMREVLKQAWSFVPQDVGARVLAEGLIELSNNFVAQELGIQLLVHVHDACLMQVPIANLTQAKQVAQNCLSRVMYGMHFPCDMKIGRTWYEAS
jgi:DNA polymerase I-like protein with 3'-5' exonuclease and polymerase domains